MKKARIMIAQDAKVLGVTTESLENFDLVVVSSIREAKYQVAEDGIDLFVIGVHFDDSQAIELVNFIRSDNKHKTTPIIFVRLMPTTLKDILKTTILALVKAGRINQYLELEGDPDFAAKIRQVAVTLLPEDLLSSKSTTGY